MLRCEASFETMDSTIDCGLGQSIAAGSFMEFVYGVAVTDSRLLHHIKFELNALGQLDVPEVQQAQWSEFVWMRQTMHLKRNLV